MADKPVVDGSKPLSRDLTDRLLSHAPTNKPSYALNDLLSMTKQATYTTPAASKPSAALLNQLSPIPVQYGTAGSHTNGNNSMLLTPSAFQSPNMTQQVPLRSDAVVQSANSAPTDIISPSSKTAIPLIRSTEQADLIDLTYGCVVSIQCCNNCYINTVQNDESTAIQCSSRIPFGLILLHSKNENDRSTVRYQDTVCVTTVDGQFISVDERGVISLKPKEDIKTRFTIQPAMTDLLRNNTYQHVRGNVKIIDTIALKSCYSSYITLNATDNVLSCTAAGIGNYSILHMSKLTVPLIPDWLQQLDVSAATADSKKQELHLLSVDVQEQLLINDLLSSMLGFQSTYIHKSTQTAVQDTTRSTTVSFTPDESIRDISLLNLLQRILPVCTHYCAVKQYCDIHNQHAYGLVNHALISKLRDLLKEYMILVAQLETQYNARTMTLLRLHYFVQPSLNVLSKLHTICDSLHQHTGGALLNVLYNAIQTEGDSSVVQLYEQLLSSACQPYFSTLSHWLSAGVINDPYNEFFVMLRNTGTVAQTTDFHSNWDDRYIVRNDVTPTFLTPISDRIVLTGKYLNVINETGHMSEQHKVTLKFSLHNPRQYIDVIDTAYNTASKQLLTLLLSKYNLIEHLHYIKRYFLLSQGDYYTHFIDSAYNELQRSVSEVNVVKLNTMLDAAVRATNNDNADNERLSCHMHSHTLLQQLMIVKLQNRQSATEEQMQQIRSNAMNRGIDCLTLKYRVQWPLSLVLSKKVMSKYNMIFRHLFQCKRVEYTLSSAWTQQMLTREIQHSSVLIHSYALQHRMLQFIQQILYYMTHEILEPNFATLVQACESSTTIDDIFKHHNTFLDACLKQCLLTNSQLIQMLTGLFQCCLDYSDAIVKFFQSVLIETTTYSISDSKSRNSVKNQQIASIVDNERYKTLIRTYKSNFDHKLNEFLTYLRTKNGIYQYDNYLSNLLIRLDYNEYYAEYFATDNGKNVQEEKSNLPNLYSVP